MPDARLRNRIRVFRAEHRMTQADLAAAIGVSRKTISTIEVGRFVPSTVIALLIARHFEVPVEEIFSLDDEAWRRPARGPPCAPFDPSPTTNRWADRALLYQGVLPMTSFRALLSILVLALAVPVSAVHGQKPERITHTLTASASGQERAVTVRLPRSYHERDGGAYPVLYVLDGESNLEHASCVAAFLAESGVMPEVIVVGVHAGVTRVQDYLLESAVEGAPSGRADRFLAFLERDLLPFIEQEYRAAPFRMISGHSYGGVFVTWAALAADGLFDAYFAQSPYLDEAIGTPLVARVTKILEAGTADPGFFFATLGEEPELEQNFGRLGALLAAANGPLRGATATEAGASHMMTRLVGLYDGLKRFFGETWSVSDQVLAAEGAAGFDRHLGELERRFGYPVLYGEPGFQRALQVLLSTGDAAGAVEVGRRYVQQYPSSVIGHFLLGNALAASGDREGAVRSIERAIERYEAAPDARIAPVYENMKTLLGRLTGSPGR